MGWVMDEVTKRNIDTIQAFAVETRKMAREIQGKDNIRQTQLTQLINRIDALEAQVRNIQVKLYSGGATS